MERVQAVATTTELKKKLESEIANQEDIFEYLRGEIHNKNNLINELQDKNLTLLEDQERLTQEHERAQQVSARCTADERAQGDGVCAV
jgi:peptidoglycan hydrolase CwlO-like protein